MFRTFNIPISWGELFKRTIKEFSADNCLGLAAQLAYYLLLALVPAIVFVVALTSFLPGDAIQRTLDAAAAFMPQDVLTIIQEQLRSIANGKDAGLLTFGFLFALWSSSAAIVAVTEALNRAYDIEEARPWWKVRLTAIVLTLFLAAFVLVALGLILVGPTLAEWLAAHTGLGAAFEWTWKILQWPLVLALVATAIAVLNYYAPDAEQDWTWVSPGAVVATVLWVIASLAFKLYLTNFADYNETYGSLGGVIVLMLWFYISSLAVLAGAEMNAEIEHASPYGKDPGEKVPGQRKKIGSAAAREYEARKRGASAPQPQPRPQPVRPATGFNPEPAHSKTAGWFPGLPVFLTTWFFRRRTRG
jgi:membrane protein